MLCHCLGSICKSHNRCQAVDNTSVLPLLLMECWLAIQNNPLGCLVQPNENKNNVKKGLSCGSIAQCM